MKRTLLALGFAATATFGAATAQAADVCSVWLVENSTFMGVPFGMFHAGPCLRTGQHQPEQQYQHGRSAGQRRCDQVRQ